jgi:hypothetical protein
MYIARDSDLELPIPLPPHSKSWIKNIYYHTRFINIELWSSCMSCKHSISIVEAFISSKNMPVCTHTPHPPHKDKINKGEVGHVSERQLRTQYKFVIHIDTSAGPHPPEGLSRMMSSQTVASKGLCSHCLTGWWEDRQTDRGCLLFSWTSFVLRVFTPLGTTSGSSTPQSQLFCNLNF